jgi:O-antigen ligase
VNVKRAGALIQAIAIWGTLLAVYGFVTVALGVNPILDERTRSRFTSSFENPNAYATYAMIGLLANVAACVIAVRDVSRDQPRARSLAGFLDGFLRRGWIFACGALLASAAIMLTQSRAGVAAAGIAILTFALAFSRRGRGIDLYLVAAVLVVVAFVALPMATGVLRRAQSAPGEDIRFQIYSAIRPLLAERLWLGHGLGAFEETFRPHVPLEAAQVVWDYAHSSYLENLVELGIVGAVPFYAALVLIVVRLTRGCAIRRRHNVFPAAALAIACAAAFHAAFDFTLQIPATAAMFAYVMGLGLAQSFPRSTLRDPHLTAIPPNAPPRSENHVASARRGPAPFQ